MDIRGVLRPGHPGVRLAGGPGEHSWRLVDPRAALTLCPTQEAYDCSIQRGMPTEKMMICGFPTRAKFCDAARVQDTPVYDGNRPLNCLLMSGGEGSGNMLKYAGQLLKNVDCRLEIICGRNEKLKEDLESQLSPQYSDRLTVYGFLDDVPVHKLDSDWSSPGVPQYLDGSGGAGRTPGDHRLPARAGGG